MLYDQDGISPIFEVLKGIKEHPRVFGVETDSGFVKDVADAGEVRPKLCCQPYPLSLSTGKRFPASTQRKVRHTEQIHKGKAGSYLSHNRCGYQGLLAGERKSAKDLLDFVSRMLNQIPDRIALNPHSQGFWS